MADWHADPLAAMTALFERDGEAFRLPSGGWVLTAPEAAKAVLGNLDAKFEEHSDFFLTAQGTLAPRAAQTAIARAARILLTGHLQRRAAQLPELVAAQLFPASDWPDAGNWLVYEHVRDALLHPGRPPHLHRLLRQAVQHGVLAGARERRNPVSRAILRTRVLFALSREIERSRRMPATAPSDLLDVVAKGAPYGIPGEMLAENFLGFVFATAGSIGFLLGWCLHYSAGMPHRPAEITKEALRLAPVAWMFGRRPAVAHSVGGVELSPGENVNVCTYLTHRHPGYWSEPNEFRPQRWASAGGHEAYLPFGWGQHACTGAAIATGLAEDILTVLQGGYRLSVRADGTGPHVGSSLAPPGFTLDLQTGRQ